VTLLAAKLSQELRAREVRARSEEHLIDRRLVVNLIVTYLESGAKRADILDVIARILDFNEEQKQRVGLFFSFFEKQLLKEL
jgi:hypothetical protein